MKAHLLLLALVCFAAWTFGPADAAARRELLKRASASSGSSATSSGKDGLASASASAASKGGVSIANAFASTEILEDVESIVVSVVKSVASKAQNKACGDIIELAEDEVQAAGTAIAGAYSSAFGSVETVGDGEACADASASGSAEATAFVDVLATAIVEERLGKTHGRKARKLTKSIFRAVSAGTATAFADAYAAACASGDGSATASQDSFAEAVVGLLVDALALALGGPSCLKDARSAPIVVGAADELALADAVSETTAQGDAFAEVAGTAEAGTQQIDDIDAIDAIVAKKLGRCRGDLRRCCRVSAHREGDVCDCSLGGRRARLSAPRCSAIKLSATPMVWLNSDGYRCKC